MKPLPRLLLLLVAPGIVGAENMQSAGHAGELDASPSSAAAMSSAVVYSSATWIVCANTSPGPKTVRVVLASGKSHDITNGIISPRTITYSLIDLRVGSTVLTHRAVYDGTPEVLGVLKNGTLLLGVQRAGPCIRFIGRDGSVSDQELLIDGQAHEAVYLDDDILVLRRRVSEGASRAILVPVQGTTLDVARRTPLLDEKGTLVEVPRNVRFERVGAVLRWQDDAASHFSTIPASFQSRQ